MKGDNGLSQNQADGAGTKRENVRGTGFEPLKIINAKIPSPAHKRQAIALLVERDVADIMFPADGQNRLASIHLSKKEDISFVNTLR